MSSQSNNKLKLFIKTISNDDCYNEIFNITDDFKSIKAPSIINSNGININIDYNNYISVLKYKIENSYKIYYGELNAPNNNDITKQVIGKGGCYLYLTTIVNRILFIWHDRNRNVFRFWSSTKYGIMDAIRAINDRVYKKSNNINENNYYNLDEKLSYDNCTYSKIRLCSKYYYVKDGDNNNLPVYTVIGNNLLGKLIGYYTIDNDIPTINLVFDDKDKE